LEVRDVKFRAVIKRSGNWWIGWLVNLSGVNAQEKTKEELLESLRIGAEDMLPTEVELLPEGEIVIVDVKCKIKNNYM
jgi:predicted RNase H-like HicB family nuclease